MSDTDQHPVDLDTLTDDQVMELGPEAVQALMDQEGQPDVEPEAVTDTEEPTVPVVVDAVEPTVPDEEIVPTQEPDDPVQPEQEPISVVDPESTTEEVPTEDSGKPEETNSENKDSPKEEKEDDPKTEENTPSAKTEESIAVDFFKQVSAPFKADGKDVQIRSANEAIRLMQMGVNYSRRMKEMKPMRQMDAMLKQHGLNDPQKLSYLIDLQNGKPEAIQKLLKEKQIDPLDIDTSKDPVYQATNYAVDPKDVAFKEAIDNTLIAPGGQDLINSINTSWDDSSKEALKEEPEIFNNLLEQKSSGVYDKINTELEHQRTMGYLTTVPFLQAYHQVGDAMQKAGVFKEQIQSGGLAPLQTAAPVPLDTGIRKAAKKPKTEPPNPNLSSTPPRAVPSNDGTENNVDYSSMSDGDFLKLGAPS